MKVFFHTSELNSLHSLFRGYGLYSYLDWEVKTMNHTGTVSWVDLIDQDIVILQRPNNYSDIQILNLAKRLKKPVIVEWDFDPLSTREYDIHYATYSNPQITKYITECLIGADLVVVGNEKLLNKYKFYNPAIYLYKSFYPLQFESDNLSDFKSNTVVISDMYSTFKDWKELSSELRKYIEKYEWFFEIIITNQSNYPLINSEFSHLSNVTIHRSNIDMSYLSLLEKLNPAIVFCPYIETEYTERLTSTLGIYSCYSKCVTTKFDPNFELTVENLPVLDFKKYKLSQIDANKQLESMVKSL